MRRGGGWRRRGGGRPQGWRAGATRVQGRWLVGLEGRGRPGVASSGWAAARAAPPPASSAWGAASRTTLRVAAGRAVSKGWSALGTAGVLGRGLLPAGGGRRHESAPEARVRRHRRAGAVPAGRRESGQPQSRPRTSGLLAEGRGGDGRCDQCSGEGARACSASHKSGLHGHVKQPRPPSWARFPPSCQRPLARWPCGLSVRAPWGQRRGEPCRGPTSLAPCLTHAAAPIAVPPATLNCFGDVRGARLQRGLERRDPARWGGARRQPYRISPARDSLQLLA